MIADLSLHFFLQLQWECTQQFTEDWKPFCFQTEHHNPCQWSIAFTAFAITAHEGLISCPKQRTQIDLKEESWRRQVPSFWLITPKTHWTWLCNVSFLDSLKNHSCGLQVWCNNNNDKCDDHDDDVDVDAGLLVGAAPNVCTSSTKLTNKSLHHVETLCNCWVFACATLNAR